MGEVKRRLLAPLRGYFSILTGNMRTLVVTRALWSLFTMIPSPYLTPYILALGGGPVEVGLVNSLGFLGMALYPLGGYVADRKGRVKILGYATYLFAFSHLFLALAPNWIFLALGILLQQISLFYTPALNAILADSIPPGARGRGFALERSLPAALGIVGPYIGALLITFFGGGTEGLIIGMRVGYVGTFVMGCLVATLRLRFLKETVSTDSEHLSFRDLPRFLKTAYGAIPDSIKWMPSSFRNLVYMQVIQCFAASMAVPFWILYAIEILGITTLDWGLIMLYAGIVGALSITFIGYLVDRLGCKAVSLISVALAIVSTFCFLFFPSFLGVLVTVALLTLSNQMVMPAFGTLIANMIERKRRGRVYSLIGEQGVSIPVSGRLFAGGLLIMVPSLIGGFIGGYVYTFNRTLPFAILASSLILCILILTRVNPPERPED